ncbi:MAG TPA: MlaD family protein [Puia sp.]|nr:MlaD family protein [Puia sp.]
MSVQGKSNVKLGLFVLAGLFLLILTLYLIGKNQHLFGSNFEVKARFRNVSGLTSGNNVRFSGIQVGTVKGIKLIADTSIEVTMLIDEGMRSYIHKNSLASIGTEGLMGNKIVNIMPDKEIAPPVKEGDLLPTQRVINTDEMLQTLFRTNNNIADISEALKSTVDRINNSSALWGILNESSLAANMKTSLLNIRQASMHASDMTGDLRDIILDIKQGKGSVGALLTDTSLAYNLQEAVLKIRSVGDKAAGLADELNKMAGNIRQDITEGPGTVHALLKDSGIVTKLNTSLDNVQKGTEAFSQDMEALKHNFLLRGYFRKLEKKQQKKAREGQQGLAAEEKPRP